MAGSSVPLAQRRPELELPNGAEIEEIISVHGGPLEAYDFHGVEVLQSLVEARKGGETGISRVQFLTGDALFKAADAGRWSLDLAEAAMAAEAATRKIPLREMIREPARAILLEYKDGLKGTVLSVGYSGVRWNAACRLKGEDRIRATYFYGGPWNNRGLFRALSHAIQDFVKQKRSPYPVERTLLATGALDAAMHSRQAGGEPLPTTHLEFGYAAVDWRPYREMGRTWDTITPDTPEPRGLKKDPMGK
jgi:transposase